MRLNKINSLPRQKRQNWGFSHSLAIHQTMARYAKAAGVTASCHRLRPTGAAHLLDHGAEVVAIRDCLGPRRIASSERSANGSRRKLTPEYLRTRQEILKQGRG